MPWNIVLEEQELIELEQGGGLSRHTESTRAKQYKDFDNYVKECTGGKDIETLMSEDVESWNFILFSVSQESESHEGVSVSGSVPRQLNEENN